MSSTTFSKRSISAFVIAVLLFAPRPALAMRAAMHWGIFTVPFITTALPQLTHRKTLSELQSTSHPDAPKAVQDLYKPIIAQTNASHVYIKENPKAPYLDTGILSDGPNVVIHVSQKDINSIEKLHASLGCVHKNSLSETCTCPESAKIQKELDAHRFIAHHEAIHVREKHHTIENWTCLFTPVAIHLITKALGMQQYNIKNGLAKCASGFFLIHLAHMLMERRADTQVPNIKSLLEGGENYFKQSHEREIQASRTALSHSLPTWSQKQIESLAGYSLSLARFMDPHRPSLQRAQAFRKRIDGIKS